MLQCQDLHAQISSIAQLCPTLCNPTDCSTPGFPVHRQLPELTQTHVHRVGDAIQPSHPLLSPSPLPSVFPCIRVFSNESGLCIRWPKYWTFSFSISPSSEYSGLISFRMDAMLRLQQMWAMDVEIPHSTEVMVHSGFHSSELSKITCGHENIKIE